jgi:hypothetical protein
MRELARINRIQGLISHIWINHPDLRYLQLVHNLTALYCDKHYGRRHGGTDTFYVEDKDWEEFLIHFKGFE